MDPFVYVWKRVLVPYHPSFQQSIVEVKAEDTVFTSYKQNTEFPFSLGGVDNIHGELSFLLLVLKLSLLKSCLGPI